MLFNFVNFLDLSRQIEIRQRYEGILNENEMVRNELSSCKGDGSSSVVYKQIGPCLIQQTVGEVKDHVEKRISFIKGEM